MEFTYTPQSLNQSKSNTWTDQAFGSDNSLNSRDWSDTTTAAYNYLMKQQDNALQVALMNYQNRYNSPQNQMLLRQAAGINPYSDYSMQGAANPGVTAPQNMRSQGTWSRNFQQGMNAVSQLMNTIKTARDTYDYARYGADMSATQLEAEKWRKNLLIQQGDAASLENMWKRYLIGVGDTDLSGSPRGQQYKTQTDAKLAAIDRVRQMASLIDDQEARYKALTALDDYRLQMLKGQNDAILSIDTGFGGLDSFLKALLMFLENSVSFSGKMF